ncbi:hypothetical protein LO80_07730 [Candidatus Francisella endociliophora]|uniref:Type IV secretion protein Rhs n=1 Tax=Candidatus Francisella endociliophora TaxID=653937 RepID=A0A097EQM0_9GAMM|nr:RHS repeat domain-containing protein [Francisella sp. FSC1006]AIT09869.1 hypothetical protein LO80_07730 [Francisella sp. FSC1006]
MNINKSILLSAVLISSGFASSHHKTKSSSGDDFSFPPTNDTQIMRYQPETGDYTKEIPIIHTSLDDGLDFNYSLYINDKGNIIVPVPMVIGDEYAGGNRPKTVGFLRGNDGQINTLSFPFGGGFGVANTHYNGTINRNDYSVYSSNGVLYTGSATSGYIYSQHKKSNVMFSYGDATKILRPGTDDNLCSYGITGIYLSEISLSNGYKLNFLTDNKRIYRTNHSGTEVYECTSVFYTGLSDNQGRKWSFEYTRNPYLTIIYPDGRKILSDSISPSEYKFTDINGLIYLGSGNSHSYSGANLDKTLSESFSGNSNKTNNTITNLDGSVDKYSGYPAHGGAWTASPANGTYKEHQKLDQKGNIIYDEVNTWGYNSNNTPYLTKQVITQDGVTTTKEFDGFDKYLFPATMTETSSDGKKRITTTTYVDIPATSTHGQMVLPETITVKDDDDNVIHSTSNSYDSEGYLISSTVDGVKTEFTYDSNGNLASSTDASGNTTKYQSYQYGKPTIVIDPNGGKTTYSYDYRGLVLSKTDPKGNTTKYTYDKAGRPTSVTPPTGYATTYSYSSNGLVTTKKQGNVTTVTTYDGLGREISSQTSASDSSGGIATSNKYDTTANKVYMSYPCSSISQCSTGDIYINDILNRPLQLIKDTSSF